METFQVSTFSGLAQLSLLPLKPTPSNETAGLGLMAGDPVHPLPTTEKWFPIALSCPTPATASALNKGDVRPLHRGNQPQHNPRSPSAVPSPPTALSTVTSIYTSVCAATPTAQLFLATSMAHGLHGQRRRQASEADTAHTAHAVPPASSSGRRMRRVSPRPRPLRVRGKAGPGPSTPAGRSATPARGSPAAHGPAPPSAPPPRRARCPAQPRSREGGRRARRPRRGAGGRMAADAARPGLTCPSAPAAAAERKRRGQGAWVTASPGRGSGRRRVRCRSRRAVSQSSGPGQTVTVSPEAKPGRSPQDGAAASSLIQFSRRPDLPKMATPCPRVPPQDGGGRVWVCVLQTGQARESFGNEPV